VAPMPVTGPTRSWYRCRIGPLSMRLPPDVVEHQRRSKGGFVSLESEDRVVALTIPDDSSAQIQDFETLAHQQFPRQQSASVVHLWADAYAKDARDFHWSMSPEEVREFMAWMTTAAMNDSTVTSVETL